MRPGRPATPSVLKILAGNPGHRPITLDSEPRFPPPLLVRPSWLIDYAAQFWDQYAPILSAAGVLTAGDEALFAAGCERWDLYRKATEALRVSGFVVASKANGRAPAPEASIAANALREHRAIMAEFGIGAASRTRVRVSPAAPEKGKGTHDRFFGNRGAAAGAGG